MDASFRLNYRRVLRERDSAPLFGAHTYIFSSALTREKAEEEAYIFCPRSLFEISPFSSFYHHLKCVSLSVALLHHHPSSHLLFLKTLNSLSISTVYTRNFKDNSRRNPFFLQVRKFLFSSPTQLPDLHPYTTKLATISSLVLPEIVIHTYLFHNANKS